MGITRRQFLARIAGGTAVTVAAALGVGCGPKDSDPSSPPTLRYGEERCSYCTMSIDDPRFASAWRIPSGSERHFDDIGCMVDSYRRDGPAAGTHFWVHHYRTEEWMDASVATYVIAPAIKTPMAYGVAAFASPSEATAGVPSATATLSWAAALSAVERKG